MINFKISKLSIITVLISVIKLIIERIWMKKMIPKVSLVVDLLYFFDDKWEGEKIENKILSLFSNVDRCNSMRKIRRLKAGEYIHSHVDLIPSENVAKIKFGIILYLNDDFDGGEIYYKDIDLTIKPKKNSILIHESTIPHEVLRVVNGKRYSMTTFIWGNNETSFIIA